MISVRNTQSQRIPEETPFKERIACKNIGKNNHPSTQEYLHHYSNIGYKKGLFFSKSSRDKQVPYYKSEKKHAQALDKEAECIHCFSLKKFIEVEGPRGEVLLGYLAFNTMVYYYRPASML